LLRPEPLENDMKSKSSHFTGDQILEALSKTRAERVLLDWTNLPGTWPLVPVVEPFQPAPVEDKRQHSEMWKAISRLSEKYPEVFRDSYSIGILILRDFLREAWTASDPRHRDWYVFKFRDFAQKMIGRIQRVTDSHRVVPSTDLSPVLPTLPATIEEAMETLQQSHPSALTPLEALGVHFQMLAKRARRCLNPDCPAPYFLVKKKGQKYCSDACSVPAQRAAKLRWWNENRKTKRKRKKGRSQK
jgi:hypothetical protein